MKCNVDSFERKNVALREKHILRMWRISERRKMSRLQIHAMSFSDVFMRFPDIYSDVNSIL